MVKIISISIIFYSKIYKLYFYYVTSMLISLETHQPRSWYFLHSPVSSSTLVSILTEVVGPSLVFLVNFGILLLFLTGPKVFGSLLLLSSSGSTVRRFFNSFCCGLYTSLVCRTQRNENPHIRTV